MNIPNNQVLRQISDFDCECGDDFKQPFEQTDIPKLWVELPISGSNIVNGTFASSSGGFYLAASDYVRIEATVLTGTTSYGFSTFSGDFAEEGGVSQSRYE